VDSEKPQMGKELRESGKDAVDANTQNRRLEYLKKQFSVCKRWFSVSK
jgi:hypothetical protein